MSTPHCLESHALETALAQSSFAETGNIIDATMNAAVAYCGSDEDLWTQVRRWLAGNYAPLPPAKRITLDTVARELVALGTARRELRQRYEPPWKGLSDPYGRREDRELLEERLAAYDATIAFLRGAGPPCPWPAAKPLAEAAAEAAYEQLRDGGELGLYGKTGVRESARLQRRELKTYRATQARHAGEGDVAVHQAPQSDSDDSDNEFDPLDQEARQQLRRDKENIFHSLAATRRLMDATYVQRILGNSPQDNVDARDPGRLLVLLQRRRHSLARRLEYEAQRDRAAAQQRGLTWSPATDPATQKLNSECRQIEERIAKACDELEPYRLATDGEHPPQIPDAR